jgi:hypothetical protein
MKKKAAEALGATKEPAISRSSANPYHGRPFPLKTKWNVSHPCIWGSAMVAMELGARGDIPRPCVGGAWMA